MFTWKISLYNQVWPKQWDIEKTPKPNLSWEEIWNVWVRKAQTETKKQIILKYE